MALAATIRCWYWSKTSATRRSKMVTAAARYSSGSELARLGLADLAEDRAGRHLLGVDVQLAAHDLDQPPGVGVVVDGERALVAEAVTVGPQDAHAGRVEGRHPHPLGPGPDQLGHPACASRRPPCW